MRGNSTSSKAQGQNKCNWLQCGEIQIAGSGGINGGSIEVYNNYIVTNYYGDPNGKGVTLLQQKRTDCNNGGALSTVNDVHVHNNTIDLALGGLHGGVTDFAGGKGIFNPGVNTFVDNQYILGANTSPFTWNGTTGGDQSFWKGFGFDTTGTFR